VLPFQSLKLRVRKAFLIVREAIFNVTEASQMFGRKFGCVKRFNNIDTVLKVDCCIFGYTKSVLLAPTIYIVTNPMSMV
jgi:hypothetical protein